MKCRLRRTSIMCEVKDITRLECPAYSPNLNMYGTVFTAYHSPIRFIPELRRALIPESKLCGANQDSNQLDNLELSMT